MSTSREPKLVLVALMLGIAVASAPWCLGRTMGKPSLAAGFLYSDITVTEHWNHGWEWFGRGIITKCH